MKIPIFQYDTKAFTLNKSEPSSLDFVINRYVCETVQDKQYRYDYNFANIILVLKSSVYCGRKVYVNSKLFANFIRVHSVKSYVVLVH